MPAADWSINLLLEVESAKSTHAQAQLWHITHVKIPIDGDCYSY